ncbi:MAG: AMP-binding protein [Gammaproteobacteria bacterium]|nr:AMP-binding protein [Gammaproteobacteria bacterium]NIR84913.1 AMP-binding protein [Gammaproteobacteria bacterium]NIR91762.1 AMP-binding protein [Gammaproteobacteria bacterium]NIU05960.1 AMP-binding protein [Gammaproteobacteria bacterium]NIV53007.1 AMP-binding protein [Gammaproteobacteria bacterium]
MYPSGYRDAFARDSLPPRAQWPELIFTLPRVRYPARLNAAVELLDRPVAAGHGSRVAFRTAHAAWRYADLLARTNQAARVLTEDMALVSGNRVLLRGFNSPMLVACLLGVLKAGGIPVPTMPLLRRAELRAICERAQITHCLCDARLRDELPEGVGVREVRCFHDDELERTMAAKPPSFHAVDTAQDDVALIAFTSGTTGAPKGTMHFHRDLIAICDCAPPHLFKPAPEDIFTGSSPLAFTFGLGGLVLFPMRYGASGVLLERPRPAALLEAIERHRASVLFTTPTAYRMMLSVIERYDTASLRLCVASGEHLTPRDSDEWLAATGIRITEVLGSTEMLHCFIGATGEQVRPGATGTVIPGYEARIVDAHMNELPTGHLGRLAVRGPTGCRYLADPRQREQVVSGWNLTGDHYHRDEGGYFWFQGRADDLIISSGYNIGAPEVENALCRHPAVRECAVVGAPDPVRGQIVKAFVALRDGYAAGDALSAELQDFVKRSIAPYKYPRAVAYLDEFPRTETGKIHRARLREMSANAAHP